MGAIKGQRSVEIDAPIERVFEIAADVPGAVEWQGSLQSVDVVSTDDQGRAVEVDTVNHTAVKSVKGRMRFSYDEPTAIQWEQLNGDAKAVNGSWAFEDLGDGRTRATYALAVDPGRMLGLLIRGPVEGQVKNALLGDASEGLKRTAEA
ncbi:MAG: SRPBCC family protein [Baekduia sp.]